MSEDLMDRVAELRAWAQSRIEHCRRDEDKFAHLRGDRQPRHPPQSLVEAWTERRALQAVLGILDGENDR